MIAPRVSIGARPHRVTLENPNPPVADGDGSFVQTWDALTPPRISVEIRPASGTDVQRLGTGTTAAVATHVITGPFHPAVTTKTRVLFGNREFHVQSVTNLDERNVDMVLLCNEVRP